MTHDRVVLVTGAGSGLGRSHAHRLARLGTLVVVNDIGAGSDGRGASAEAADRVVAEIRADGGEAVASHHDVGTVEGAQAAVQTALDAYGRLDGVVNNAGILRDRTFAKLTPDDFDAVVRVHLAGSAYTTMAAWPALRESGEGRVVFTSSASGLYGQFGQANYAAAKAAMIGLTNVLKQEGAKYGILVNTIAPVARTRMTEPLLPEPALKGLDPDKVSPLVGYLMSVECRETGLILEVGGGLVARVQVVESEAYPLPDAPGDIGELVRWLTSAADPGDPYGTSSEALARIMDQAAKSAVNAL